MIDLRKELEYLLKTEVGGIGHWIVIRHFTEEHNEKYWKPETREGVGGPAYKYIDSVVLTYSAPALPATSIRSEGLTKEQPLLIEESIYKFVIEHDVVVKNNDEILELNYNGKKPPTIVLNSEDEDLSKGIVKPKERYKVRKVEPFRCDNGRIEFKIVYVDKTIFR